MQRRRRYKDRYKMGSSSIAPYMESESWNERHRRRMEAALENQRAVQSWCNNHKWTMNIKNNGHHWIFITYNRKTIEWFPSSGKLVIGKNWKNGIHCHDYTQLLKAFEMTLK